MSITSYRYKKKTERNFLVMRRALRVYFQIHPTVVLTRAIILLVAFPGLTVTPGGK